MNKDEFLIEFSSLFDVKLKVLQKSLELKIETEFSRLDRKLDSIASRLDQKMDTEVSKLETATRHSDNLIENEVIPRLKNLEEACKHSPLFQEKTP